MPVLAKELQEFLRCPRTGQGLRFENGILITEAGDQTYQVTESGIPLFAEEFCSADARAQQQHYNSISRIYQENLAYPHTLAYQDYLDKVLLDVVGDAELGSAAEICCGAGEAFQLLGRRVTLGVGVDVSINMLESARARGHGPAFHAVQGDATRLPLKDGRFDSVFMLGGVHHVNDRRALFAEVARILKPGGRFFWREPVSDFFLWRWIRAVIYRMSPILDFETESPLRYDDTVPVLEAAGLAPETWRTVGFLGGCLFLNSDVLVFNRLFRFIPGIRALTRAAVAVDDWTLRLPGLARAGLQVVGSARRT